MSEETQSADTLSKGNVPESITTEKLLAPISAERLRENIFYTNRLMTGFRTRGDPMIPRFLRGYGNGI
ncbi:MAG: hypothetical protein HC887_00870 [Desulfobacteraceae bacterium]|nr:hypothetical protein [Desulfobacteraceae bacterium]